MTEKSLSDVQQSALQKAIKEGMDAAGDAASKISGKEFFLSKAEPSVLPLRLLRGRVGIVDEKFSVSVMRMTDGLSGTAFFAVPLEHASTLARGLSPVVTRDIDVSSDSNLTPLEGSALSELGSILLGAFLAETSLDATAIQSVPSFATGMLQALLNEIVASYVLEAEETLVIHIKFFLNPGSIPGQLVLLLDPEASSVLLDRLGA